MAFAWIFWDPNPVLFYFPIIGRPVVWYGLLFTLGFILGYGVFYFFLYRYFKKYPSLIDEDLDTALLYKIKTFHSKKAERILSGYSFNERKADLLIHLNKYIDKAKSLEGKIELRVAVVEAFSPHVRSLKKKTLVIADKFTTHIVIATLIGARLFHVFFYEKPSFYLNKPMKIIAVWEGGLASHGGAIAIIIAIFLFAKNYKNIKPQLDPLRLLDLIAIPALCAAVFIRLGNFFGQEILGKQTDVFWAVIFGSPADRSLPVPRHPVTLYEASFYLVLFGLFFLLKTKNKFLNRRGRTIGLFLISVFSFRFFIEFFKERQSDLLNADPLLTMGQYLSIPLIALGIYLFFFKTAKIQA